MSDITCSMHGVHPGSFTFSLVDAYIYHEYLKKIFAVDAVCVQRAVTLSRQWTQTASKAAERVKHLKMKFKHFNVDYNCRLGVIEKNIHLNQLHLHHELFIRQKWVE